MHKKKFARAFGACIYDVIFQENMVRECHSACASVVLDDGRASATVEFR